MARWQAYADKQNVRAGTGLLITGEHRAVRVQVGDQLVIQTPDSQRVTAVVVDRSDDYLAVFDVQRERMLRLRAAKQITFEQQLHLSEGFSKQTWVIQ